jgi:hypothetical protein
MLPVPGSALQSQSAAKPQGIVSYQCCNASVNFDRKEAGFRASGSAGGSAADPERGAPATPAPAAEACRKADKRRAAAADAAGGNAYDRGAPSEGRPGKRHRAAAAGAPGGDEAGVARAALGAAEAEARFAGEAADEDNDEGDARAALRRLGVRKADPRFAAALAHERADFAKQARSSRLCAVINFSAATRSRTVSPTYSEPTAHCHACEQHGACRGELGRHGKRAPQRAAPC